MLVRRGVEPKAGYWSLPSGYVEADELTEAAAIRETQEETGPEIEIEDLLGVYSFGREPPTGVLILYSAHTVGGALRAGDDTCDVQAFAPANSRKTTKSPFEPICRRCTIGAEGEPSCTVRRFRPSGRPLLN